MRQSALIYMPPWSRILSHQLFRIRILSTWQKYILILYQELIQVIQISTRAPWCSVNSHKRVPSQFISNYLPSTLGHLLPVQASHWSRQITCIEDWHLIGQGGTHTHTSPVTLHYYVRTFKTICIFVFLRDPFFSNLSPNPTPIHM